MEIHGFPIFSKNLDSLIQEIKLSKNLDRGISYHFLAAHAIVEGSKDTKLAKLYLESINLCDSLPLSKYLSFKYGRKVDQIRGADFMRKALKNLDAEKGHFLLGGVNRNTDLIVEDFNKMAGRNIFHGSYEPPLEIDWDMQVKEWIKLIEMSQAKFVWIGLGAPKQFYISKRISEALPVHCFSVGAAFDFLAGSKRECPKLLSKIGLEWLFRLLNEPKRLWRRYLIGNVSFIKIIIFDYIGLLISKKS